MNFNKANDHRYGLVLGSPIIHSLSPQIHKLFAKICKIDFSYAATQTDNLATTVDKAIARGTYAFNVTLPLKEQAWKKSDQASAIANLLQAANVLSYDRATDRLHSYNTDVSGLVRALQVHANFTIAGKRILLIGAGGAARAAALALLRNRAMEVAVINRTYARALELVTDLSAEAVDCNLVAINDAKQVIAEAPWDMVINASAHGHQTDGQTANYSPQVFWQEYQPLSAWLGSCKFAYDLSYGKAAEYFLGQATAAGCAHTADGLAMLVEQAALSFALWHQIMPSTKWVIAQVRK